MKTSNFRAGRGPVRKPLPLSSQKAPLPVCLEVENCKGGIPQGSLERNKERAVPSLFLHRPLHAAFVGSSKVMESPIRAPGYKT